MFNEFNPYFKEQKVENIVEGKCCKCSWFRAAENICVRYNMISEPCKTCKSYREKK